MKYLTNFFGAAALAVTSNIAYAAPMTAGGVVWDEFGLGGIAGSFQFQQWFSNSAFSPAGLTNNSVTIGDVGVGYLSGVGAITGLYNGRTPAGEFGGMPYCVTPGCILTFSFGGLQASANTATGFVFDTSDAWLNIYYHATVPALGGLNDALHEKITLIQSGNLWASLRFDNAVLNASSLSGVGGSFDALLSFESGLPDVMQKLSGKNSSDLFLNSSAIISTTTGRSSIATGQFESIPTPTTIALLGFGLIALAGRGRIKKQ